MASKVDLHLDLSALAATMLEWEQKKAELDDLEMVIKHDVMMVGKTLTVGNVRASYSGGRKTYNYQTTAYASGATPDEIRGFTTQPPMPAPVTDWKGLCESLGISKDETIHDKSKPTVTVKLI